MTESLFDDAREEAQETEAVAQTAAPAVSVASLIAETFNKDSYLSLCWEGSFDEYLTIVEKNPMVIANAWMRLYNMISSKGVTDIVRFKKKMKKYNFFSEHPDYPIFGLESALEEFVDTIHAGARGYGPEKRVLLLHGPVGSSKSTICTLLKRGLEEYSRTDEGSLYTYKWDLSGTDLEETEGSEVMSAIHEEPLNLLPAATRQKFVEKVVSSLPAEKRFKFYGDTTLNPRCQFYFDFLMKQHDGDVMEVLKRIKVVRFLFNEKSRDGIGTFQPKDEKNQDSTELTGDINFRKLSKIGIDSDPRAFNFDGEFQIANRGLLELIEVLKLSNEFLYDLLGASQERQIKPKKFSQMNIDEVLIGHSVHGDTPIPHEYNGVLDVLPISKLSELPTSKIKVFSLNEETREIELTEIKSVFSHAFEGEWVINEQDGEKVTTTPNHSVYNDSYELFYPGEDESSTILQIDIPEHLIDGKQTSERWIDFFAK